VKNEELKVKSEFLSSFEGGQRGMIEISITSLNLRQLTEGKLESHFEQKSFSRFSFSPKVVTS
jgi:hypothetical protein